MRFHTGTSRVRQPAKSLFPNLSRHWAIWGLFAYYFTQELYAAQSTHTPSYVEQTNEQEQKRYVVCAKVKSTTKEEPVIKAMAERQETTK